MFLILFFLFYIFTFFHLISFLIYAYDPKTTENLTKALNFLFAFTSPHLEHPWVRCVCGKKSIKCRVSKRINTYVSFVCIAISCMNIYWPLCGSKRKKISLIFISILETHAQVYLGLV